VFAAAVGTPSPWRDEVATLASSRVPVDTVVSDARTVDAVHVGYYLLVHLIDSGGGGGVLAGRWLSVFCLAATVGLTVLTGAVLRSPAAGVVAGAVLAVSPLASRYAQEARPFAGAALAATAATLALLRATTVARVGWWVAYAGLLVAVGVADVLALAVLLAHLGWLAVRGNRGHLVGWMVCAAGALLTLSPLLVVVFAQRRQVGAPGRPPLSALAGYVTGALGSGVGVAASLGLLVAGAVPALRGSAATAAADGHPTAAGTAAAAGPETAIGSRDRAAAVVLAAVWGLVIPLGLFTVSRVHPLFAVRYLVFCLPGIALLWGITAARVRPAVAVLAVLVVAGSGLHQQLRERGPSGHGEDLVALDAVIAAHAHRGDDVVFIPWSVRRVSQLDPALWAGLENPVLTQPDRSTALFASRADSTTALTRLDHARRVLLIARTATGGSPPDPEDAAVAAAVRRRLPTRTTISVEGFTVEIHTP